VKENQAQNMSETAQKWSDQSQIIETSIYETDVTRTTGGGDSVIYDPTVAMFFFGSDQFKSGLVIGLWSGDTSR